MFFNFDYEFLSVNTRKNYLRKNRT